MLDAPGCDADVKAMRIPDILGYAGVNGEIDLLKCDVEGAEGEIFANCSDWIARVRNILVEIHSPCSAASIRSDILRNGGAFQALELLEPHGLPSLLLLQREGAATVAAATS
jgi:hypothetical protein